MIYRRLLLILLALAIAAPSILSAKLHYRNPTGREFPIMAWFSILGDSNLTHQRYAELRDAGFNLSFSHFTSSSSLVKGLRACRGTGVKIMATCGAETEEQTRAVVGRFKHEQDLAGWFLRDEPTVAGFPALRALRDSILATDSRHLLYLNLLPIEVPPASLQAESYEDYVQRFVDEVGLNQISYDMYPVVRQADGSTTVKPAFYDNLEHISRVARRNGMPFWAFCLATAHGSYPVPTEAHMRFEAFSALAYGAQCIQYFTYWTPLGTIWDFHNAPIDSTCRRTEVYYRVRRLNGEIQALAPIFLGCKVADVSHLGDVLPRGTKRPTSLPYPFSRIETSGAGALVSQLSNGRRRYIVFVSHDINRSVTLSFDLSRSAKHITPDGRRHRLPRGRHTVTLPPGGYYIVGI